jgi:hypothetical protein
MFTKKFVCKVAMGSPFYIANLAFLQLCYIGLLPPIYHLANGLIATFMPYITLNMGFQILTLVLHQFCFFVCAGADLHLAEHCLAI